MISLFKKPSLTCIVIDTHAVAHDTSYNTWGEAVRSPEACRTVPRLVPLWNGIPLTGPRVRSVEVSCILSNRLLTELSTHQALHHAIDCIVLFDPDFTLVWLSSDLHSLRLRGLVSPMMRNEQYHHSGATRRRPHDLLTSETHRSSFHLSLCVASHSEQKCAQKIAIYMLELSSPASFMI